MPFVPTIWHSGFGLCVVLSFSVLVIYTKPLIGVQKKGTFLVGYLGSSFSVVSVFFLLFVQPCSQDWVLVAFFILSSALHSCHLRTVLHSSAGSPGAACSCSHHSCAFRAARTLLLASVMVKVLQSLRTGVSLQASCPSGRPGWMPVCCRRPPLHPCMRAVLVFFRMLSVQSVSRLSCTLAVGFSVPVTVLAAGGVRLIWGFGSADDSSYSTV